METKLRLEDNFNIRGGLGNLCYNLSIFTLQPIANVGLGAELIVYKAHQDKTIKGDKKSVQDTLNALAQLPHFKKILIRKSTIISLSLRTLSVVSRTSI